MTMGVSSFDGDVTVENTTPLFLKPSDFNAIER